jgi:hypothetical protein
MGFNGGIGMYGMMMDKQYNIGIDFDETISLDPVMWLKIMYIMEQHGFNVYVVTWRHAHEYPEDLQFLVDKGYKIFYTGRLNKRHYMSSKGIDIDIMIDDSPEAWCFSMSATTGELY